MAVVGSANVDDVVHVQRRPEPGETVLADRSCLVAGGKGLNQAMAAAAVAATAFVGCVGDDREGEELIDRLRSASVDVTGVHRSTTRTGRALITVTADAENSIVVAPLANWELGPAQVHDALSRLEPRVVLTQLEVAPDVTEAVVTWCRVRGARLVLNPSPIRPLSPDELAGADPLICNEGEGRLLAGAGSAHPEPAELAAELAGVARSVVVTAGPAGAAVVDRDQAWRVPAPRVRSVDTTGAGDVFAGTLAGHLSLGAGLAEAAREATTAAAAAVARPRRER